MNFKVLTDSKTKEEYIYLGLEGSDLSINVWNKLLQRINDECQQCGYERIMIDLSKLTVPVSVATVYRAASSPMAINLLPFRLAWVNSDEAWLGSWKSLELIMRNRALPWRIFSDLKSAEIWLALDRHTSLQDITQNNHGQLLPTV